MFYSCFIGARTWADLASKSPHVSTDTETARKKVTRVNILTIDIDRQTA